MASFQNSEADFSPLRIAMEHMIYRQGMTLDEATLFFILYSGGLVRDNLGKERMHQIFAQALEELENEPAKDEDET